MLTCCLPPTAGLLLLIETKEKFEELDGEIVLKKYPACPPAPGILKHLIQDNTGIMESLPRILQCVW